ncbi:MAG: PEGA domain-containing protein, partial [Bacteroidaceae bacterium]|nr:PEGA domain-containing protein [Bacteroidaceae bacterium]
VQRNAKHVTITREGYNPVRRYDLRTTIQPGLVYSMVLSPQAQKIQKQWVYFKITPADSDATIMYKRNESNAVEESLGNIDENGELGFNMPLGRYSYRIISRDYHNSEGLLVLDNPKQTYVEEITLRPKFAAITLSVAGGAEIYIDGERKGSGSWSGRLNKGSYNIECRKANHKAAFETITVEEGKDAQYTLQQPTPIVGSLSIASSPLGAKITIDGKEYGTTPCNIDDLLIGSHKVTLSKDGYESLTVDITINEGETTEENVALKRGETKPTQTVAVQQIQQSTYAKQGSGNNSINGHEYVDLGLPSGLKWATCNVGASKPEDYGDYYAWGETDTKRKYTWATYKWCNGSKDTMTKYCTKKKYGTVDNKTVLEPKDDVAHVRWGGSWRMPTRAEMDELREKCTWVWTTVNSIEGYKVTGPNGNSLFLPAAGYRGDTDVRYRGTYGYYRSSSLGSNNSGSAWYLYFSSSRYYWINGNRYSGDTVRPVSE